MTDIAHAVRFLGEHLEWIRHHPAAAEHLAVIDGCAAVMRGLAAGPRERIYLGPCGAAMFGEAGGDICEARLYGRLGAARTKCRTCGAQHNVDQRIAERSELAGQYTYTAAEIAEAYPGITAVSIRVWRHRGLLQSHGEGSDGQPLYDVGEVLALAATKEQRQSQAGKRRVAQGAGMGATA